MSPARLPLLVALGLGAALPACNGLDGSLTSTATPLGSWTFTPTRCTATGDGLALSSQQDPLRYVAIERASPGPGASAPSILLPQAGQGLTLTVLDLGSPSGAPVVIPASRCRTLTFDASGSFTTRINGGPRITSYSGSATIDCAAPDETHRLVGRFEFTCPER